MLGLGHFEVIVCRLYGSRKYFVNPLEFLCPLRFVNVKQVSLPPLFQIRHTKSSRRESR